jgi:hypothetical protein
MPTRESQENRKNPAPPQPRKASHEEQPEARERSRIDPFADENPSICRGID